MKAIVFCILSLPLITLSWRTLFSLKKHGLYRLLVWECILWLAVQNHRYLIVEEFDLQQLISSALMIASLVFVLSAVFIMREKGGVSRQRSDHALFGFEKTTVLIESGIFKHVRHPMYSSLLLLAWGVLLRHIEVTLFMVALAATGSGVFAALIEEKENLAYFGESYRHYMLKTKMFIPYVI
ncbi:MAG: isoprenylcysteine carboxylmethyltransferase family protein [Deltaproteobacteria bacterium]|nr:isoprenylcysteine carboxylmethyltransferase family protein [Deltaproteobacteria bacterium]